jgi:hypothetical protein
VGVGITEGIVPVIFSLKDCDRPMPLIEDTPWVVFARKDYRYERAGFLF